MKVLYESKYNIDRNGIQSWFEENFNNDCGYTLFSSIVEYLDWEANKYNLSPDEITGRLFTILSDVGVKPQEIDEFVFQ